ncbi:MAG: DUF2909 domain-containing protein [Alishewanella agri]|jgi:hypothetical protein|uniref:DUF2909 domain-containing protein n=1 Tax=Alishewanella agri BL06 TaxID=1195246 RepID=I8U8K6_9ALTE|nr:MULTISPECIES: DUF2909 domain-containing protein [Alishewanella]EIW88308.1 hypothetical protein AGRI_11677 [Alishewanella agri BL06]KRS20174.1 hypothetical protein AAY72_15290 [Alishewanella sp. WH16-1]MDD4863674.1 DUF2909 domain-containing protein [Alishewanella agri]OZB43345.1 MAG: hypothetical protein B7X50_01035 [Alishewanella sp. 34-51-39]
MLIKIIICALLLFIVINLVRAGVAMLRQQDSTLPMSHFLGRRVLYSAVILVLILVAMALGLITPNPRPY